MNNETTRPTNVIIGVVVLMMSVIFGAVVLVVWGPQDSTPIIVTIVGAVSTVAASLLAVSQSAKATAQATQANEHAVAAKEQVQGISDAINGRMDQLVSQAASNATMNEKLRNLETMPTKTEIVNPVTIEFDGPLAETLQDSTSAHRGNIQ